MTDFNKKNPETPPISLSKILGKSTILALLFTVPSLGIFLAIYYTTCDLLIAAVVGFSIHFVIFAFSGKISKLLMKEKK